MKAWDDLTARISVEFKEKFWDSEAVLKIRQKFSELDTQSQSYVLIGSFAAFVLLLLVTFFTIWGRTISLKNELVQMDSSIRLAQNSAVHIQELKSQEQNRNMDSMLRDFDVSGDVSGLADRVIAKSLIKKETATVTPGTKDSVDVKLEKISLRQLVRALYLIEKSGSGTTVEKLSVDTKDDPQGYLWAELTLKKEPAPSGAKGGK
jgi:hypothetical protein